MSKKKQEVKITDLEANNTEEVKGGAGLSINTNALQNIGVGFNPMTSHKQPTIPGSVHRSELDPKHLIKP